MSQTTLAASVASSDTTVSVDSVADLVGDRIPPYSIAINAEEMRVLEASGDDLTVIRSSTSLELIASDTFDRIESGVWGYSDDGQNFWQGAFGTGGDSVTGVREGRGYIDTITPLDPVTAAFIMQTPLGDLQARTKFYLPDDLDGLVDLYLRTDESPNQNSYRARLTISGAGAPSLRLSKNVAAANTALAGSVTPAGTVALDAEWNIAFQATGMNPTSLAAKAWATADGEPAAWDTTASDSEAILQDPNHAGLRWRGTNANTSAEFDDWKVSRIPEGVTHDTGDTVVLVEDWPYPSNVVCGMGPPASNPPTGAEYIDCSTTPPTFYRRVGANWWAYP